MLRILIRPILLLALPTIRSAARRAIFGGLRRQALLDSLKSEEKFLAFIIKVYSKTISTGKLNALRHLHCPPIDLVVYKGSSPA